MRDLFSKAKCNCAKLFARDKKGDVKYWQVDTDGANIIVEYGSVGGKAQKRVTTAKGKNKGKANETSPSEQAVLEARSKWNKKRDREGYVVDLATWGAKFFPMLAQNFQKHATRCIKRIVKLGGLFFTQPKLDGVRSYFEDGIFLSRKRDPYPVMQWLAPHVSVVEKQLCENLGVSSVISDGEFWKRGIMRQDISGAVKKKRDISGELQFHIFDFYCPELPELSFKERTDALMQLTTFSGYVCLVPTRMYDLEGMSEKEMIFSIDRIIRKDAANYKEDGYEGGMGRTDEPYEPDCRSNTLWKVKDMREDDFEIVGTEEKKPVKTSIGFVDEFGSYVFDVDIDVEAVRKDMFVIDDTIYRSMRQALFTVRLHNGIVTEVSVPGGHKMGEEVALYPERFIGKILSTQYQGYTKDGDLEFGVGLEIRHDI